MGEKIKVVEMYRATGGAVNSGSALTSDPVDLRHVHADGNFALHVITTGGTLTATLLVCSTKTGTYMAPTTPVVIFNAVGAGSYFAAFTVPTAAFIKILFTCSVANMTAMDAWLNYQ